MDDLQDLITKMDDDGNISSEAVKPEEKEKPLEQKPAESKPAEAVKPEDQGKKEVDPPSPTNKETVKPESQSVTNKDTVKPDALKDGEQPKKYAGKFSTGESLVKAVDEISKALKLTDAEKARYIKPLIESGNYDVLEKTYLNLEKEYEDSKKNPPPEVKSNDQPSKPDPIILEKNYQSYNQEKQVKIDKIAVRELYNSPLYKEMREAGIELGEEGHVFPQNEKELRQLKLDYPAYYKEFTDAINSTRERILYVQSLLDTRESLVESEKKSGEEFIKSFSTKFKLTYTDAEISKMVDNFLDEPDAYEDKEGVLLPRKGAIKRLFFASVLPDKIDELIINAEARGSTKAADELRKLQEGVIESASTSGKAGVRRHDKQEKVDIDDPRYQATVTEAENQRELNKLIHNME